MLEAKTQIHNNKKSYTLTADTGGIDATNTQKYASVYSIIYLANMSLQSVQFGVIKKHTKEDSIVFLLLLLSTSLLHPLVLECACEHTTTDIHFYTTIEANLIRVCVFDIKDFDYLAHFIFVLFYYSKSCCG